MTHTRTVHAVGQVERQPAWYFAPPVPAGMREPGTNWFTIVTAHGPHTTGHP